MDDHDESSVMNAFGKAIKVKRVEIGLTQEELAEQSGLARSFVSGVERGEAKATIISVWKIAKGLKCLPSELWLVAERLNSTQTLNKKR
ncbi:helix-turn-helix domain-containing protein [Pseudoalteromonas sp. B530]|uniref:helix-turn-helix domain-containing protein n=1 Tax=Pseudoalteromonas sp. B530 TaxID=2994390 RepID=UPI00224A70F7|nr:helix-turn-helix transcriptional regulator [Pseudoalteromonas sp. B530]MCX2767872.1 helix-turn-helix transcriptional regulator [Pseudoalteromonas sp. B530]